MANAAEVRVKIHLQNTDSVGEWSCECGYIPTYEDLKDKIRELFPSVDHQSVHLLWRDGDGDMITFSSDEELEEAVSAQHQHNVHLYINSSTPEKVDYGEWIPDNLYDCCDQCYFSDESEHSDREWSNNLCRVTTAVKPASPAAAEDEMEITQEHQPQLPAPMPDNAQLCLREMQDLTIKQDCDISGSPIRPDSGEHVKDGFDEAWEDLMQGWMDNKCDTHT